MCLGVRLSTGQDVPHFNTVALGVNISAYRLVACMNGKGGGAPGRDCSGTFGNNDRLLRRLFHSGSVLELEVP